jgi:hypothetical protein
VPWCFGGWFRLCLWWVYYYYPACMVTSLALAMHVYTSTVPHRHALMHVHVRVCMWCCLYPSDTYTHTTHWHIVCPALTLANGAVSYSAEGSTVERDVGSVATHTCNFGFRLEVDNAMSPQATENTRTCSTSGWSGQDFVCGEWFSYDIVLSETHCMCSW